jgi:iron complex outermembrane recepter protein
MRARDLGFVITGTLAVLLAAAPAQAQEAIAAAASGPAAEPAPSEDIIVTAQKREQTLIDVPQSVSVVSGAALERNQATSFQDYAKLIPGFQISQSNPGEARLVLRGINTGGVAATVATYVDETPFGSSSGQVNAAILAGEFDTFDVARVEVLRGPQGTLYGASSLGGVVKFVTAPPRTDKVEARARGSIETVEGGDLSYMGSALINVPLSDTLAIRGSGFYRSFAGFIDSVGTGGSDRAKEINDSKSYGGRISALFTPSSDVSIRLTAILQNLKTDAANVVESDPTTLRTLYGRFTQSQFVPEFTDIRYRLYNGTITADLGFADLTSATSYSTLKQRLRDDTTVLYGSQLGLYDPAAGPAADIGLDQQTNVERWTQELRLSNEGPVFDWLVGGYYSHEKGAILQRLEVFDPGTLTPTAAFPPLEAALPGFPLLADLFTRSTYEEFAGFANGTLHFGERFDLTFGGRYSHNSQDANQGGVGPLAPPALSSDSSEDVFTWSVAPKVKFGDHASLYARAAKGFRPGGPNIVPVVPPGEEQPPFTYDSDSLVSYEIGFKAETADRRFGIDIAAFHIDWSDIQLYAQVGNYGVNANGGSARSNGVEFTATMRPTAGLTTSVNGAYTDAKLTDDTSPLVGGRDGDRLPFNPEWSVNVNGDYEWALGGNSTAYVGGSIRLLDRQIADYDAAFVAANNRQIEVPSYTVIDLRAGVDLGRFSIEAYVKNLGNSAGKTSVVGIGNFPNGAVGTGVIRPRTIGLTLGAGF